MDLIKLDTKKSTVVFEKNGF